MSRSPAPLTDALSAPISVGDHVLLHPWHLYDDYTGNLYAKVLKCDPPHLFVRTRTVTGANGYPPTALRILPGPYPPRRVPNSEVNGHQTGKNLYKAVAFEYAGEYLHGQIVDYVNRPPVVSVRTKGGVVSVNLSEVFEVPPPIALLCHCQEWKTTTWNRERLLEAHQALLDQIRGFDLLSPLDSILDHAFTGIGTPSTEPIAWKNTVTGKEELCRPFHAALFLRLETNWPLAPSELSEMLGEEWCADPACEIMTCEPDVMLPDLDDHSLQPPAEAAVTQSTVNYVPSVRPKRGSVEVPNMGAPRPAQPEELAQNDAYSVRGEEDDRADWDDEELSQASDAVIRCLNNSQPQTSEKQTLRARMGITDASFQDTGRRAKKLHYPSTLNNLMSKAFHSEECNRMDAQSLIESFGGARFPWNVHPYMSIRLRNAQFGPTGARGYMFRKVEERERRAWLLEHAEHLQDYGENCKVFDLPPLTTKQELVEAYSNLVYYFSRYGSELAKTFGSHLQWFLSSLQTSDMATPDAVNAHMEFIDSVLANFARAVTYDMRNNTNTHEAVHLQLSKGNPELVKELNYLMDDRMRALEAGLTKKRSADTGASTANKKSKKTIASANTKSKSAPKPHDSAVLHLVAKHEGKQVCLRHLSVNGCYSKDPVKCSSEHRVHHVPSEPLPAEVWKHIGEKWGGVAAKYLHLSP